MSKMTVGRSDAQYFAVNDKPMGISTSFRVSGRRGELGKRYPIFSSASEDCKRLNKAFELGREDAMAYLPELIEAAEELIYEISHLSPREDRNGKEVYRPIVDCSKVDALRSALSKAKGKNDPRIE